VKLARSHKTLEDQRSVIRHGTEARLPSDAMLLETERQAAAAAAAAVLNS